MDQTPKKSDSPESPTLAFSSLPQREQDNTPIRMKMTIGRAKGLHKKLKETALMLKDVMGERDPDLDELLIAMHSAIEQGKTDYNEMLEYRELKEKYELQTRRRV